MNQKLKKRGPDEEGYFVSKNINLGHKRLSVINKENGIQPSNRCIPALYLFEN